MREHFLSRVLYLQGEKQLKKRPQIDLQVLKYHNCEEHGCESVLLVDISSESSPYTDRHGRLQYFCLEGLHVFTIGATPTSASTPLAQDTTRLA